MPLARLDRIVEFDAANLCVTVEAGREARRTSRRRSPQKTGDPPARPARPTARSPSAASSRPTLSGPVAAPLRDCARDWVLGMRVALPERASVSTAVGKVIKNVSGYDMNKLFIGSLGTLGIVTEVDLQALTRARSAGRRRRVVPGAFAGDRRRGDDTGIGAASGGLGSPRSRSAVALLAPRLGLEAPAGAYGLAVALAGSPATVERQARDFATILPGPGRPRDASPGREDGPGLGRHPQRLRPSSGRAGHPRSLQNRRSPSDGPTSCWRPPGRWCRRHGMRATVIAHAGNGDRLGVLPDSRPKTPPDDGTGRCAGRLAARGRGGRGQPDPGRTPPPLVKARIDAWGKPGDGFSGDAATQDGIRSSGTSATRDDSSAGSSSSLKTAHLRRWPASPLAAAYLQYASLGLRHAALHLSLFEQPGESGLQEP